MKQTSSAQKVVNPTTSSATHDIDTGSAGAAVAPPAYGMGVADQQPIQLIANPQSENKTGLPDALKAGIEHLSGLAMDDVRVHYNSTKPAQVHALAYTQGAHIHIGPGQERHLPHEAWHVVQQSQKRVRPTTDFQGLTFNHDNALEQEASQKGQTAVAKPQRFGLSHPLHAVNKLAGSAQTQPIQLFAYEFKPPKKIVIQRPNNTSVEFEIEKLSPQVIQAQYYELTGSYLMPADMKLITDQAWATRNDKDKEVVIQQTTPDKQPAKPNEDAESLFEQFPSSLTKLKQKWGGKLRPQLQKTFQTAETLPITEEMIEEDFRSQQQARETLKALQKPVPVATANEEIPATLGIKQNEKKMITDEEMTKLLQNVGLSPGATPKPLIQGAYMSGDRNAISAALIFEPRLQVIILYEDKPNSKADKKRAEELEKFYRGALAQSQSISTQQHPIENRIRLQRVNDAWKAFSEYTGEKADETGILTEAQVPKQAQKNKEPSGLSPGVATTVAAQAFQKEPETAQATLEKAWLGQIPDEMKKKLEGWVTKTLQIKKHSVLIWIRQAGAQGLGRPELDMNEFTLEQIRFVAKELGRPCYLIGDEVGQAKKADHPLLLFWEKMEKTFGIKDKAESRLLQMYVLTVLRDLGCVTVGMRSGILEPNAMLGMPTISIEGVSAGKVNERLRRYVGRLPGWRALETVGDIGEDAPAQPLHATRKDLVRIDQYLTQEKMTFAQTQLKNILQSILSSSVQAVHTEASKYTEQLIKEQHGKITVKQEELGRRGGSGQKAIVEEDTDLLTLKNALKNFELDIPRLKEYENNFAKSCLLLGADVMLTLQGITDGEIFRLEEAIRNGLIYFEKVNAILSKKEADQEAKEDDSSPFNLFDDVAAASSQHSVIPSSSLAPSNELQELKARLGPLRQQIENFKGYHKQIMELVDSLTIKGELQRELKHQKLQIEELAYLKETLKAHFEKISKPVA